MDKKRSTRISDASLPGLVVLLTGCGVVLLVLSVVVLVLALRRRIVVIVVVIVLLLIHFYHLGSMITDKVLNIHISVCRIIKIFSVFVKS